MAGTRGLAGPAVLIENLVIEKGNNNHYMDKFLDTELAFCLNKFLNRHKYCTFGCNIGR